jgi:hypothetical protein
MSKPSTETLQEVKDQAVTLAQAIIEQAADHAVYGADRAREAAGGAKGRLRRAPKTAEGLAPTVRDVALQAAAAAIELWQAGKERAGDLAESAEQVITESAGPVEQKARGAAAQVVHRADEATDRATERAREVGQSVAQQAGNVAEKAKTGGKSIAEHADAVTSRAKDATKSAADATVSTSKDTAATLFWMTAAAGIVFYALLDQKRREQVLRAANSIATQVREVVRDIQGYDEDFE